ncbi:MAG TPA: inositol monophosphatase family protein [Actinopolymorphaceae bacterium]
MSEHSPSVRPRVEPSELLRLAADVAREAGDLLRSRAGLGRGDIEVAAVKTSPTDVVTAMDTAAEALIRDRLTAARPDDGFFGEEGSHTVGTSGVTWIVDPLDGTVNYLYGLPSYAVSIAASLDRDDKGAGGGVGEVVAGAVFCPPTGELWTATRGGGAFLDGSPIRVNPATELAQALVGTGFWYDAELRARQASLLTRVLPRVRDIRRIGSAAVDLCGVACGRLDAFYETGLHPWDHAAGVLVAEEAGARAGGPDGGPPNRALTVVSAPGLFDDLYALVHRAVSLT